MSASVGGVGNTGYSGSSNAGGFSGGVGGFGFGGGGLGSASGEGGVGGAVGGTDHSGGSYGPGGYGAGGENSDGGFGASGYGGAFGGGGWGNDPAGGLGFGFSGTTAGNAMSSLGGYSGGLSGIGGFGDSIGGTGNSPGFGNFGESALGTGFGENSFGGGLSSGVQNGFGVAPGLNSYSPASSFGGAFGSGVVGGNAGSLAQGPGFGSQGFGTLGRGFTSTPGSNPAGVSDATTAAAPSVGYGSFAPAPVTSSPLAGSVDPIGNPNVSISSALALSRALGTPSYGMSPGLSGTSGYSSNGIGFDGAGQFNSALGNAADYGGYAGYTSNDTVGDNVGAGYGFGLGGLGDSATRTASVQPSAGDFNMAGAVAPGAPSETAGYDGTVAPGLESALALAARHAVLGNQAGDYSSALKAALATSANVPSLVGADSILSEQPPPRHLSPPTTSYSDPAFTNLASLGGIGSIPSGAVTSTGADGAAAPGVGDGRALTITRAAAATMTQVASDAGFSNPVAATGTADAAAAAAGVGSVSGFVSKIANDPAYAPAKTALENPRSTPTEIASALAEGLGNDPEVVHALLASGAGIDTKALAKSIADHMTIAMQAGTSAAPSGDMVTMAGLTGASVTNAAGVPSFTFNGNTYRTSRTIRRSLA